MPSDSQSRNVGFLCQRDKLEIDVVSYVDICSAREDEAKTGLYMFVLRQYGNAGLKEEVATLLAVL
jgi:hypothetical protein